MPACVDVGLICLGINLFDNAVCNSLLNTGVRLGLDNPVANNVVLLGLLGLGVIVGVIVGVSVCSGFTLDDDPNPNPLLT